MVKVEIINKSTNEQPLYRKNKNDAGIDIRSNENRIINNGESEVISTQIYLRIPDGYYGQIQDRSGLAVKYGVTTMAGVIDSEYRGEVKVVLLNTGDSTIHIAKGDRIAQLVIHKLPDIDLEYVDSFENDDSKRGVNGFGSTGVK